MENKYIAVAYKLYVTQDGKQAMVEEAPTTDPFRFISGMGSTLDRFEAEIAPLSEGATFQFTIPVVEAYGDYIPEGVRTVSKEMFHVNGVFDEKHIYPGAVISMQDNEGHSFNATITAMTPLTVTVDLNHPYAGKDLTFVGKIVESRPATNAEIQDMANALVNEGCCCRCGDSCENDCACQHSSKSCD